MKPQTQYLIVLVITFIILIFSIINLAYFIRIRNDDNPEVSKEAPIGLIVMNGIIIVAGTGIFIYCLVNYLKSDKKAVEAKIFKHFRDDVSQNKAILQNRFDSVGEPALICDKLNGAVDANGNVLNQKVFDNVVNGFQNLGLNIYEFINECEAEGLIKPGMDGNTSGLIKALDGYNSGVINKRAEGPDSLERVAATNKAVSEAAEAVEAAEDALAGGSGDPTDVAAANAAYRAAVAAATTANAAALAAAFKAAQGR